MCRAGKPDISVFIYSSSYFFNCLLLNPVLGIRDIFVRIRIGIQI